MTPALVVPDEMTWTMAGHDPAGFGLVPAAGAERARALLAPQYLPEPLATAVAGEWRRAGDLRLIEAGEAVALRGRALASVLAADPEGHDHGAGGHHDHGAGGHDHGDMMAITGDPSADGLVMESIDLRFGPLSGVLPGGLAVDASLDGDVVARCQLHAMLRSGTDADVADPLSPVAWAVVELVARELGAGPPASAEVQWRRLAAVELERALSHVAWARSLARLLGWAQFVETAQRAVAALLPLQGTPTDAVNPAAVAAAAPAVAEAARLVGSRRFAARTRGRGHAFDPALAGPNARAAGLGADGREGDPLYAQLGFEPVREGDCDALARSRVRLQEAESSLALARAALDRANSASGPGTANALARVEGPRGPLHVAPGPPLRRSAPGAGAALAAAGVAATGLEWSAALVTLVSLDLSPWTVGA